MSRYLDKLRQFSRNARLVLMASFVTGLAFGGFRLLFNFYVLSLGDDGVLNDHFAHLFNAELPNRFYNEAFIGTLQTAEAFAAIMIALPAAYVAVRYSQKVLLIIVTFIGVMALGGIVAFPSTLTLISFRMGFGMAVAAREVIVAPFLMNNTNEDERQWVFSFNIGMMMTAMFVGNTLGGSLPTWMGNAVGAAPTSTIAYQLALGVLAGLAIFAVIPLMFLRPIAIESDEPPANPVRLLRENGRALLPYFIPNLIVGLGAGLMQPFMNVYFRKVYGQPDPIIGFVFALGGISMAVAQFVAPPLADAKGKINAVLVTQALSIPFLLLLGIGAFMAPSGMGDPMLWFIIAAIAYNFRLGLMNMGNPIYQTFMLERVPEPVRALSISLSSISFQFGWFIMPSVSGELQVRFGEYGFVPIFFTVAFFYLMAIIAQLYFFKHLRIGETEAERAKREGRTLDAPPVESAGLQTRAKIR